jgi:hypothetical protein
LQEVGRRASAGLDKISIGNGHAKRGKPDAGLFVPLPRGKRVKADRPAQIVIALFVHDADGIDREGITVIRGAHCDVPGAITVPLLESCVVSTPIGAAAKRCGKNAGRD